MIRETEMLTKESSGNNACKTREDMIDCEA